jgi:hypothetical protein
MPISALEGLCNSMSYKFSESTAARELGQTCIPCVEFSKTHGVNREASRILPLYSAFRGIALMDK